jgi:hypothetical protein
VEKAICADEGLRKLDSAFGRSYSELVDRLDSRQRQELIESQRLWIRQRDAQCQAKPQAELVSCISDVTIHRESELAAKSSDGRRFGSVVLGHAGQTVTVGAERLDIAGESGNMLSLIQGNTLLAESLAPFEVDGRAGDENGEAIVVSTHDFGNLGCSNQYLISASPKQPLRVEELQVRDSCSTSFLVEKDGRKLSLTIAASPGEDGIVKSWSAESGIGLVRNLVFSPKRGTTMSDFHDDDSPTDNEEFFNSLKRAAPRDWRPMARALQFARVRADEAGKYVLFSPCSGFHGCPAESAFAAYEKASQKFFFAYEVFELKYGRDRSDNAVVYYPERSRWPTDLSKLVDKWVQGEMRD